MTATRRAPKISIRQNAWGNWYGYVGGKRVEMFSETPTETQETMAKRWKEENEEEGRLSVKENRDFKMVSCEKNSVKLSSYTIKFH